MSGTRAPGWPGGLTAKIAALVRERFGTPCYVYDRAALEGRPARLSPSRLPSA